MAAIAESPNKSLAMVPSTSSLLNAEHSQPLASPRRKENFNEVERGAPGDASLMAMVKRDPEEVKRAKQKSSFYGEVFAYREPTTTKDRVARESPITAEVKTNVIVRTRHQMSRAFLYAPSYLQLYPISLSFLGPMLP